MDKFKLEALELREVEEESEEDGFNIMKREYMRVMVMLQDTWVIVIIFLFTSF